MGVYIEVMGDRIKNGPYAGFKFRINLAPTDYQRALPIILPILEAGGFSYKYYDPRELLVHQHPRSVELRQLQEAYWGNTPLTAEEREQHLLELIKSKQQFFVLENTPREKSLQEELLEAIKNGLLPKPGKVDPEVMFRQRSNAQERAKQARRAHLLKELEQIELEYRGGIRREEASEEEELDGALRDGQIVIYVNCPSNLDRIYAHLPAYADKDAQFSWEERIRAYLSKLDKAKQTIAFVSSDTELTHPWEDRRYCVRDEIVARYGAALAKISALLQIAEITPALPRATDLPMAPSSFVSVRFDLFARLDGDYIGTSELQASEVNAEFEQSLIFRLLKQNIEARPPYFREVYDYYQRRKREEEYTSRAGRLFKRFTFNKAEKLDAALCLLEILIGTKAEADLTRRQLQILQQGRLGEIAAIALEAMHQPPRLPLCAGQNFVNDRKHLVP